LNIRTVNRSGSPVTVFASFLHFDLCFTVWVILGALGIYIAKDLGLNNAEKGLMVAIPTLSGSIMRIVIGLLSDRYNSKHVGTAMLVFIMIPLLLGWLLPVNFPLIVVIALMIGVAGASFAVALPLASRWYPPSKQGLVMGIAAAGNIGSVIANLFAPRLAEQTGWHSVMGMALLPVLVVLFVFVFLAKENPHRPRSASAGGYLTALKRADLWWFSLFYSITFGGFVGLSTFLPIFFNVQYHISAITAGTLTAIVTFMGSSLRPVGGFLADKFGGTRMLTILFAVIGILYIAISRLLPVSITFWLFFLIVSCLGMGNGSVFQLVPQRFRKEIGVATGIVGAFGGLGGFFLPALLGSIKQFSDSFATGLLILALIAFAGLLALRFLIVSRAGWRLSWATTSPVEEEAMVS
jgi:NNP family nitrate/nitrite transporter-like MFS transporter